MKPLYKIGAYVTAVIHSVYVPFTLINVLRPDPTPTAIANLGICATGMSIGFFIDYCPLTFVEKWFRRHYSPRWVFRGGWVQYYGTLAWKCLQKLFS